MILLISCVDVIQGACTQFRSTCITLLAANVHTKTNVGLFIYPETVFFPDMFTNTMFASIYNLILYDLFHM